MATYPPGTNTTPSGTLIVGSTPISNGTSGYVLYDNAGILGEQPGSGGSPGGTNGQIQYNNLGAFGGAPFDYNVSYSNTLTVASGVNFAVGNAYVATTFAPTGFLILYDSTGTAYQIAAALFVVPPATPQLAFTKAANSQYVPVLIGFA